jgi:hypothetical protein
LIPTYHGKGLERGGSLITPPSTLPPDISYKAPLRKWHIVLVSIPPMTARTPEALSLRTRDRKSVEHVEPTYRDFMFAECIATDAPRLKEK